MISAKNRHDRKPTWTEKNEKGRWRSYDYEELSKRDKINLDIFWLKDDALEESANLPAPAVTQLDSEAGLSNHRRRHRRRSGSSLRAVRHDRGRFEKIISGLSGAIHRRIRIDGQLLPDIKTIVAIGIFVRPPKLLRFLSELERDDNLVLLDIEIAPDDQDQRRITLNVVFNCIPVRRKKGKIRRYNWYIGTRGVQVKVMLDDGAFTSCTEAAILDVESVITSKKGREFGGKFGPALTLKTEGAEKKADVGSVSVTLSKDWENSLKFVNKEFTLIPSLAGNTVMWTYNQPLDGKAVREFLIGNLPLFAIFSWAGSTKKGRVRIAPEDVDFFDAKRRTLGWPRSLLMRYNLRKEGISVKNADGFSIGFQEVEQ